jgi:hypothetical protein
MPSADKSRSDEQSRAEEAVLLQLQRDLGLSRPFERHKKVKLGDATVEVDGYSDAPVRFVEVYAHVGRLKGGQFAKVARDAFKLWGLGREHQPAALILAFVDAEAQPGPGSWLTAAIDAAGIERQVVEVSEETIEDVRRAQRRQRMINADDEDELSGDGIPETL